MQNTKWKKRILKHSTLKVNTTLIPESLFMALIFQQQKMISNLIDKISK